MKLISRSSGGNYKQQEPTPHRTPIIMPVKGDSGLREPTLRRHQILTITTQTTLKQRQRRSTQQQDLSAATSFTSPARILKSVKKNATYSAFLCLPSPARILKSVKKNATYSAFLCLPKSETFRRALNISKKRTYTIPGVYILLIHKDEEFYDEAFTVLAGFRDFAPWSA